MIIVIQCAASKRSNAGHGRVYARPDDRLEDGTSWRQLLQRYNDNPGGNPLHLYPAYQLYQNTTYEHASRFVRANS
jgi:hypothetical protein